LICLTLLSREVRETWIRAKYVDRAFVASPILNGDMSTGKKLIRKWSVRKPFRREKWLTESGRRKGNKLPEQPQPNQLPMPVQIATTSAEDSSETESFKSLSSASREDGETGSVRSRSDSEVLVFGAEALPSQTDIVEHVDPKGEESAEETDSRETGKSN